MSYLMHYRRGHPSGYTDDLGILADRNQWVPEEPSGWYCYLPCSRPEFYNIGQWCSEQLRGPWLLNREMLWIARESEATLFNLTWG